MRLLGAGSAPNGRPLAIAGGRLLANLIALLTTLLSARLLGADGRGVVAAGLAAFYIVGILLAAGVPMAIRRRVARGSELEPTVRAGRRFATLTILPAIGLALPLAVVLVPNGSTEVRAGIAVLLLLTPIQVAISCDCSAYIARRAFGSMALIIIAQPLTQLFGVGILAAFAEVTPLSFLAVVGASSVLTMMLSLAMLPYGGRKGEDVSELVTEARQYYGAALAEAASNRLDQMFAVVVMGVSSAGFYSVAVTVGALPLAFAHAFGSAIFSDVAAVARAKREEVIGSIVRESLVLGVLAAVPLALTVPWALPIIFGSEFSPAVPAALIACGTGALGTTGFILSMTLAAEGRGRAMTKAQVWALSVNLLLFVPLGQALGATGAAVSSICGAAMLVIMSFRSLGIPLKLAVVRLPDIRHTLARLVLGVSKPS